MRNSLNCKLVICSVFASLILFITGLHAQVTLGNLTIATVDQENQLNPSSQSALLAMKGRALSPEAVSELENKVAQNPDDLNSQTLLLGFYFSNRTKDNSVDKKIQDTVLWLIRNHPEAAVLGTPTGQLLPGLQNYAEGEKLWGEQLLRYPSNSQILYNAAHSFITGQNLDLAIDTLKHGRTLNPTNAGSWDRDLGNAYKMKFTKTRDLSLAKESLNSLESAYAEDSSYMTGRQLLPDLAKAALAADEIDKAVDYANQMLSLTEAPGNYLKGDMVYNGNYVLGMVAIKKGNDVAAAKYLLLSGDTPGSPVLSSFGPNMSLAKELLDRGQRDTVLAFLTKCLKFWTSPIGPCSKWIQQMEEGQTPDFHMNLNY